MATTTRQLLYQPIGTLRATATAVGGTATRFHCTNADASDITVGQVLRLYDSALALKEDTNFTVIQIEADTPGAGTTRITYSPASAVNTAVGDFFYEADVVSVAGE